MSSMRRARSSASPSAAAGWRTTSGGSPVSGASCSAHLRTRRASRKRRSRPSIAGGRSRRASPAMPPVAASANTSSSSSISPIGTMRGSTAASTPGRSRKASRASRQARRVGRKIVASAKPSGPVATPSTSRPSANASISAGRNGADGGMVKTRAVIELSAVGSRHRQPRFSPAVYHAALARIAASATGTASGVPTCSHTPSSRRP